MNMFGSFLRVLWLVCPSKVYSGLGADIVHGIITVIDPKKGEQTAHTCVIAWFSTVDTTAPRAELKTVGDGD